MKQVLGPIFWLILCFTLSSCGGSETNPATSEASRFTKAFAKGCDVLTAELAASTFNVPAQSLRQTKVMGCIYTWSNETEQLQASIMRLRAHKTTASAVSWFATSTRNRSAQEMQAEMDRVMARMEKREDLGSAATKSATKSILSAVASKPVVYEDFPNVGDEARSSADGGLSVRVDNLTFTISAYQGPKQPKSSFSGLDVKQMMALAEKETQEWETKSAAQRTQDSAKLAKAIIATL